MTLLKLANDSPHHFLGWLSTNIDVMPPHRNGSYGAEWSYMLGEPSGLDTHNLDLYVGLAPGERKTIDLTVAEPMDYNPHRGLCAQNAGMWGGVPVSIAGEPLAFVGATENGAAFDGHWRGRIGEKRYLHVDLFVHWYPDDPQFAVGEIVICASNPALPNDVVAFIPRNFRLEFGDAEVLIPGKDEVFDELMTEGDWLADGQARILSLVLCWKRHGGNLDMCRALADQQVTCLGLAKLHQDGNPHLPEGFDARAWAAQMLPGVIEAQHHWRNSPLDPNPRSADTGAQGSQAPGVGGPAMAHPAAVGAFYIAALDASWPMNHLEADGSPLDWKAHPGLHLNGGRVNRPISTDNLGKLIEPTLPDCHGHAGPDWEHWFDMNLFAGARLRGTPGTQWVMRFHAIHFLHNFNVPWSPPNRGIGWYSLLAVELNRGLADRELAEAVKAKWCELWTRIIQPKFSNGGWWSWTTDPRIGGDIVPRAVPWQAAIACCGLSQAGFCFGVEDAWNLGASMSAEILDRAYEKQPDGRWASKPIIAQDGAPVAYETYGVRLGYYDHFGMPLAVATALRHNPGHWAALEIWAQLKKDSTTWQQASWLLPLPEAP